MKKTITTTIVTSLFIGFTSLHAGSGHSHGPDGSHTHVKKKVTQEKAQQIAAKEMKRYIKEAKLDQSWADAKAQNATFENGKEWRVPFHNPNLADKTKQTIYLFVSPYGDPRGARYNNGK